jgi:hypothetical protein
MDAEERRKKLTSLAVAPANRATSRSYALASFFAASLNSANTSLSASLLLPNSLQTRSDSSGAAFFHCITLPTMLGVLDPASTSARMRTVCGGRLKGRTEPAVEGAVQAGFREGERTDTMSLPEICVDGSMKKAVSSSARA